MPKNFLELPSKQLVNMDNIQSVTNVLAVYFRDGGIYKPSIAELNDGDEQVHYGFRIDLIGTSVWVFGSDTKDRSMAQKQRDSLVAKLTA